MQREVKIAEARCHTCDMTIGPDLAEDVGEKLSDDHVGHDYAVIEETETETIYCVDCDAVATHFEEKAVDYGTVVEMPYCDGCGVDA